MTAPTADPHVELANLIEAFELALVSDPAADLAAFLPPPGHPLRPTALTELIRTDIEFKWSRGAPRRLADYQSRFPDSVDDRAVRQAVLFEEYRQRRRRGEPVTPQEYRELHGVDTAGWPVVAPSAAIATPTERARPATSPTDTPAPADRLSVFAAAAAPPFPEPGTEFLGFHLVEELGRGAFGRVYLARQGELSARPVALKVADDIAGESRTLAQLQHTNIVPIYSFHRAGARQAVCMPYFGRTTLADVVRHLDTARLPTSGRELLSTVNVRHDVTVPAPRPPAELIPSGPSAVVDGWAHLDALSYVEAVLWLGSQLAAGLAHAHDRGIIHRDLKPANVLLADDGRAMLLDFNLAEDTKATGDPERARLGGTLPYMAPEQMRAFIGEGDTLDVRCDVYALGVILFELLAGRHPFQLRKGPAALAITAMLADRDGPAPALRPLNPAVTPAIEAIIRKALAADRSERYHSAEQLREDLERQLHHRPLRYAPEPSLAERARKWARRHPRLTSSTAVAAAAGVLLLGTGAGTVYARERARDDRARAVLADHRAAFADARVFLDDRNQSMPRLDEGTERLRGVLARYGVPEDGADGWLTADEVRWLSAEDRDRLRADVGEAFYRLAHVAALRGAAATDRAERKRLGEEAGRWADAAARYAGDQLPCALREERAAAAELIGDRAKADALRATDTPPGTPRDAFLLGLRLAQSGRPREALPHLRTATRDDPENLSAWFVCGTVHLALGQDELAVACFASCTALRKDFAPAWMNRGLAYGRLRFWNRAVEDYDRAAALDPALAETYFQRAEAKEALGDLDGAAADLDRLIGTSSAPVRAYFVRAHVRGLRGDKAGAAADRAEGLRRRPADELSWVAHAEVQLDSSPGGAAVGGPTVEVATAAAALADVEQALALNPASAPGLQLKAHILGERLHRTADARKVLDRAVELLPDHVPTRAGRGVELARAGDRDAALRDAREALLRDTRAPNLYQVGCIYALTSRTHPEDRREALKLLWGALKTGFGLDLIDGDADLDPIRGDPEFRRIVAAARALHAAPSR